MAKKPGESSKRDKEDVSEEEDISEEEDESDDEDERLDCVHDIHNQRH